LSRRKIAAIVFANPVERKALEAVVFPYIERGIDEQIAQARQQEAVRFVVLDAAILLETGWRKRCDWIVYVHTPRALRLQRLAQQRGWDETEVRRRSQAQLPLAEKVTRAQFVVDNSGSAHELARQIERLLASLKLAPCPVSQPIN